MSKQEWPRWMISAAGFRKTFASAEDVTEGFMTLDEFNDLPKPEADAQREQVAADADALSLAEVIAEKDDTIAALVAEVAALKAPEPCPNRERLREILDGLDILPVLQERFQDGLSVDGCAAEAILELIGQRDAARNTGQPQAPVVEALEADEDGKLTKPEIVDKLRLLGVDFDGRASRDSLFELLSAQPAPEAA